VKIKDARSLPPVAQEDLRRKAIKAVVGGMTHVAVAGLLGVTRHTVDGWVVRWRQGGMRALSSRRRGRPKAKRLPVRESAQIRRAIRDRCPEQLKLPFSLWTRAAVAELIRRKCRVKLSVWTVGRYLADWGFTPQKPLRRAYEQNPAAVRRWLEEEYPAIRAAARLAGAEIQWGDEMGLRSDHQAGRSYGLKGQTPVIAGTGQRFSCHMISTITNRGVLRFMVYQRRFTASVFIGFLRRLIRSTDRPIYLILDRHPVHRAGSVRQWLNQRVERIRFFYLPAYSPELNPDEELNNDVKSNALGRRRPRSREELTSTVRSYLWRRQRQPEIVRNYFHEENVLYAAN
jgi:transposase